MKKIILTFFFLSVSLNAQWVHVNNGLANIDALSFTTQGDRFFAGLYQSGVYFSTNNGASWTQTSLNNRSIYSLAANENNIFAGAGGTYGVYLSTDNGASWTQTSLNGYVKAIAINGNNIFAGDYNSTGVYLSTNNGTSWTQTSLNNRIINALAVSGNYIFAGTNTHGVYVSTDNGGNWTQTSLNGATRSLAMNGNYIFAGNQVPTAVYVSTDNGTSWTQTSLNYRNILSLAAIGNSVFAGTGNYGVYVSNDNGASWTQRNEGLGDITAWSLSTLNNYIFAGTWYSVYRRPLGELTGIRPISTEIPNQFSLSQNYPNPFNPNSKIKMQIAKLAEAKLVIFDILGREVVTLVNEELKPGTYEVDFDGTNYPSGVYYYKLSAGKYTETKKMVLIK